MKITTFQVLLISIFIRFLLEILFPSMYGDNYLQIHSFTNFINGKELSLNYVLHDDLSDIKYSLLNLWPFGFVCMVYPFYKVLNSIEGSILLLNTFFIVLFYYSIYKIVIRCLNNLDEHLKLTILLFFSVSIMPFRYMGTTDLWCLALLFFSVYLAIELIVVYELSQLRKLFYAGLIILSVSLMVTLRYTYWLLAFSSPSLLLIYGLFISRKIKKFSILIFTLSILFSIIYVLIHYSYFGKINPTSLKIQNGIQWSALKVFNPIIFNSLYRDSIVRSFFMRFFSDPFGIYLFQILAHLFGILVIIPMISLFKKFTLKLKYNFSPTIGREITVFIVASLIIVFINCGTIILSALKYGYLMITELYPMGYTAVAEVRYFAPTLILAFIIVVITLGYSKNKLYKHFLKAVILSGFLFSFFVNIIFLFSRFERPLLSDVHKYIHSSKSNEVFFSFLKNSKENYVFLGSPYTDLTDYYMAKKAMVPDIQGSSWNNLELKSTKPLTVITMIDQNDLILEKYEYKVEIQSIKPNIDLVSFRVD